MARKAVDNTLRRILNYTAEIIISIILLVTICIPLAFTIPMWFEHVFFDVPRTELAINPANWWGLDGTLWVTLFLGLVSLIFGYLYIIKLDPGVASDDVEEESDEDDDEEDVSTYEDSKEDIIVDDDIASEEIDEIYASDIPLEDQEEEEELDIDEIGESIKEASEED